MFVDVQEKVTDMGFPLASLALALSWAVRPIAITVATMGDVTAITETVGVFPPPLPPPPHSGSLGEHTSIAPVQEAIKSATATKRRLARGL